MNEAPAATAPAAAKDFGPRFDPFPSSDSYICTVVGFEFLKDFEQTDPTTKEVKVFDALQFFFGTLVGDKAYFLKPWPTKYSIHEKANYTKLYHAILGKDPAPGSNPKELIGKGVTIEVKNEERVSKKGVKYTASYAKAYSSVHAKLKGEIVPLVSLQPAFEEALKGKDEGAPF